MTNKPDMPDVIYAYGNLMEISRNYIPTHGGWVLNAYQLEDETEKYISEQSHQTAINKFELRAEDADCLDMWLDDLGAPKTDKSGLNTYSLVGRVQAAISELEAKHRDEMLGVIDEASEKLSFVDGYICKEAFETINSIKARIGGES
jgi:hypothetical protein